MLGTWFSSWPWAAQSPDIGEDTDLLITVLYGTKLGVTNNASKKNNRSLHKASKMNPLTNKMKFSCGTSKLRFLGVHLNDEYREGTACPSHVIWLAQAQAGELGASHSCSVSSRS